MKNMSGPACSLPSDIQLHNSFLMHIANGSRDLMDGIKVTLYDWKNLNYSYNIPDVSVMRF